jgi:2-succinyl-6-hydroxy-2,4-cyclohexadiene-1-carboxylate synthase
MIVALHGFLGEGSDWDFLREAGFDVVTPPLDAIPPSGDVLLGYSLGGRLALQALLAGADYRCAVLVSTGLGIEGEAEREHRRLADEQWARRFEADDWATVMRDWNGQPVFGGHVLPRSEQPRAPLVQALRAWSPGVLPPAGPRLHELGTPALWIAGSRDARYVAECSRGAALMPIGRVEIVEGAGHRVPWEAPEAFIERLRLFLDEQQLHVRSPGR